MIRAVTFDLDRTLLDRDTSILSFISSQYEAFKFRLNGTERGRFAESFIRLDARGSLWKDMVYKKMVAELGIHDVTWEELFADFDARISDFYVPFPYMHAALLDLKQTYQMALITNGRTIFQNRTIKALGISSYFPVALFSETEGVRKPDPEIFLRALDRLGVRPEESVYVGDHPVSDIEGATRAGMKTVWKRNSDFRHVNCDAVMDDLRELPSLLQRL